MVKTRSNKKTNDESEEDVEEEVEKEQEDDSSAGEENENIDNISESIGSPSEHENGEDEDDKSDFSIIRERIRAALEKRYQPKTGVTLPEFFVGLNEELKKTNFLFQPIFPEYNRGKKASSDKGGFSLGPKFSQSQDSNYLTFFNLDDLIEEKNRLVYMNKTYAFIFNQFILQYLKAEKVRLTFSSKINKNYSTLEDLQILLYVGFATNKASKKLTPSSNYLRNFWKSLVKDCKLDYRSEKAVERRFQTHLSNLEEDDFEKLTNILLTRGPRGSIKFIKQGKNRMKLADTKPLSSHGSDKEEEEKSRQDAEEEDEPEENETLSNSNEESSGGSHSKRKLRHLYVEDDEPEENHGYKMRREEVHDSPRFMESGSINVNFYSDESDSRRYAKANSECFSDRFPSFRQNDSIKKNSSASEEIEDDIDCEETNPLKIEEIGKRKRGNNLYKRREQIRTLRKKK